MPSPLPVHQASSSLAALDAFDPADAHWHVLFGSQPPQSVALQSQAIAWKEQVVAHGDVAAAIARDLALVAKELRAGRSREVSAPTDRAAATPPSSAIVGGVLPPASSQLVPGTRLAKAYGGKTHVVEVTAGGMLYEGQVYASLSAVAKAITGTHWNGLLFFGLRKRKVYPAKAAASG